MAKWQDAPLANAGSASDRSRGKSPMVSLTANGAAPTGLVQPGNLDLNARKVFNGPDGGYRTENSMSIGTDRGEALIPTVVNGRQLSEQEAIDHYMQTGENLGMFDAPQNADKYAESLHLRQEQRYAPAQSAPKWQSAPLANSGAPTDLPIPVETVAQPQDFNETAFAQGTSGINEGIATVLGAPVDLTNLALRAGAGGINALTGSDIQLPVDALGGKKTLTDMMGPTIKPVSDDPTNQMIRRVGQEVGAAIVPGGSVAARAAAPIKAAATQAAIALGSGAGAAVADQVFPDNPYAELAGQILGGGGAALASSAAGRAVSPFAGAIPAERAAMNQVMRDEGVDLTAGQMTGNKGLQYAESELGGSAASNMTDRQLEQFTSAALSRAGISAPRATPEVMDDAFRTIGNQFDELAANNTLIPDQALSTDLATSVREYNSLVPPSQRAPVVQDTLRDLVDAIRNNNGIISGDAYQSLTSRLARIARGSKADPALSSTLMGIRGALDDAMERSIQANNPADIDRWQTARTEYRNLLVLEQAAARAGQDTAMGLITPANLRSAVAQQGKRSYVRGNGDFADLARAGVATMTPLPNSGTAPRLAVQGIINAPTVIGAALGGRGGDVGMAALGAAAGGIAPRALGRAMLSDTGRNYLTNQALGQPLEVAQRLTGPVLGGAANQTNGQGNSELIRALRSTALN